MITKEIAVFYHYFEKSRVYKDNLIYFLSTGYLPDVDFYIVISGNCSIEDLPEKNNIFYINTKNHNFDFGGHAFGISYMKNKNLSYEKYIFINSSVRGPFKAPYFNSPWVNIFTEKLKNNTHLVGSSINIPLLETPEVERFKKLFPDDNSSCAHVQTTAYALTNEALKYLLSINFYDSAKVLSRIDVICMYEIRLSNEIIKNGWTIGCLLPEYHSIDYQTNEIDKSPVLGGKEGAIDRGVFFGRTANPMEILFIKINRNVISDLDLHSYTYTGIIRRKDTLKENWIEAKLLENNSLQWIQLGIENRIAKSRNIFIRFVKKSCF